MAGQLPGYPSHHRVDNITSCKYLQEEPQVLRRWYFSRDEIENHSPSRKDGIDYEKESGLRKLYCSFLQELGIELKVPQVTIATAMIFCHQFYMRQSHAKNHWQLIATVCMFLACKAEETPRWLTDLVVVSYKLIYKWDPCAPQRIKEKEVYDKQKELILAGERLLLTTVAYELNVEHPYKPLVAAIKRLDISHKELAKVAWNFLNDWLRTTLCLQYKPHYIAAGSLFLAAKLLKVKLPTENGKTWWMQFDVSPKQLEDVVQQMLQLLEHNQRPVVPPKCSRSTDSKPAIGKAVSSKTESCISSGSAFAPASSSITMVETGGLPKNPISENNKQNYQKQAVPSTCSRSTEPRHHTGRDVPRSTDSSYISNGSVFPQGSSSVSMAENGPKSVVPKNNGNAQAIIIVASTKDNSQKKEVLSKRGVAESVTEKERLDGSDCGSANSVVEDGGSEAITRQAKQKTVCAEDPKRKIDVLRIKETLKSRKFVRSAASKKVGRTDDEIDSEEWIERELENLE